MEFHRKIPQNTFQKLDKISNSPIFEKCEGLGFSSSNLPIVFTEYTNKSLLTQILENEESFTKFTSTKKLINIFGLAKVFLYLIAFKITEIKFGVTNVFETDNFYPKINIFDLVIIKFQNTSKEKQSFSMLHAFAKLVYAIFTGEKTIINLETLNKCHKKIPQCFQKMISECILSSDSEQMILLRIINGLKKDKCFITDEIDKDEYFKYVNLIEKFEEEESFIFCSIKAPIVDLNKYEILEVIGNGSFGDVLKIKEKKTDKVYAAKLIKFIEDDDYHENYASREVIILSQIIHPSIIRFIGFNPVDFYNKPNITIITEYFENGSLGDFLELENKGMKISFWDDTIKLINIYGIASSMEYLHSKNIMHRDLNPENILLDEHLFPKLCDFGFAKYSKNLTNTNCIGTLFFIAPEIYGENKYDKSCDVYSFAMTVFCILDYIPQIRDERKYIHKFLKNGYRPEFSTKEIPGIYKKLIKKCWAQDPNKRPSFSEIVEELKNNSEYITDKVNEKFYKTYVEFIDQQLQDVQPKRIAIQDIQKYSLKPFYDEYRKKLKDPLSNQEQTIDMKQFKIIKSIGKGGYGEVFYIKDIKTEAGYAAKRLRIKSKNIGDFKERFLFLREVSILKKIRHPSIIGYIGFSHTDFNNQSQPVIVTEFMENGSLENLIEIEREGIEIPYWNDTMKLINIYGIASSMKYLHSLKILHRDLKPDNVLLDDHLFPKLCDFGIAKFYDEKDQIINKPEINSEIKGTTRYMAPEILTDEIYSKKTDVYSFGMSVYEIISGIFPFAGLFEEQIFYNITIKKKRPMLESSISNAFKKLIKSCWSHNPKDRPQFSEIVEDLRSNEAYITPTIDKELFEKYVKFIDQQLQKNQENKQEFQFPKFSLESQKKEYQSTKMFMTGPGILSIDSFNEISEIETDEDLRIVEVIDKKTGVKYTATISNYVEKLTKEEMKYISSETSRLIMIKNPTIQEFIGFSFVGFNHQRKPVTIKEKSNGRTLFEILKSENKLAMTSKLIIIYGIAYGMSLLHEKHILNPYLNLNNVLIDDKFQPKLIEVGFYINTKNYHSASSRSSSNIFKNLNSALYLSPEMILGQNNNSKSDVYSYSFIVYALMMNKIPFVEVKNTEQILKKIINEAYRPQITDIPEIYGELIENCWSQSQNDRPSFAEIINQLENNQNFIIEDVSKEEYYNYIKYIKSFNNNCSY